MTVIYVLIFAEAETKISHTKGPILTDIFACILLSMSTVFVVSQHFFTLLYRNENISIVNIYVSIFQSIVSPIAYVFLNLQQIKIQ